MSRFIFCHKLYGIELGRPVNAHSDVQREYLKKSLRKLNKYFTSNRSLYEYYKTGSTHFDEKYFFRAGNTTFPQDESLILVDPYFTTGYDLIYARFIAYEKICALLNEELHDRIPKLYPSWEKNAQIRWTGTKAEAVELLYSLASRGVINNGSVEIKALVNFFEQSFNFKISDYYRTYSDIKMRSEKTKFIDSLKSTFLTKISEDDN